jgi:coenzyme F420-reducing hydrogenase alpha subunit
VPALLAQGRIGQAACQVVEALRLSEAVLTDRPYDEVAQVAADIHGACGVSHVCASLQATEAALGISVSEQTTLLRRLTMNAEVMSSHALRVYFLAAPDFLIVDGLIPLVPENRQLLKRAFRLKQTAEELCRLVGRGQSGATALAPGGFTKLPTMDQLGSMERRLMDLRDHVQYAVELYQSFEVPEFERPTQHVCLKQADHYGFYGGELTVGDGRGLSAEEYVEAIAEDLSVQSTAERAKGRGSNAMVGALARVNNKWDRLCAEAQDVAEALGLRAPCNNPLMNPVAQVVELVHCVEESIGLIDQILSYGPNEEPEPLIAARASRGIGMVDAPRGVLVHDYTYDHEGRTTQVNILTPTAQSLDGLGADMRAYMAELNGETEDEIRRRRAMLVRAYDPCTSCSTPHPQRGALTN